MHTLINALVCTSGCSLVVFAIFSRLPVWPIPQWKNQYRRHEGRRLLKDASAPRKPVVFLHVHKAAGTTMCLLAFANHERTYEQSACMWWRYDLYEWGLRLDKWGRRKTRSSLNPPTCKKRWEHVKKWDLTWQQVEHEAYPGFYCPDTFIYAISVREPITTMESYLNYLDWERDSYSYLSLTGLLGSQETYDLIASCLIYDNRTCGQTELPHLWRVYTHFDNFLVRLLVGVGVMQLPPKCVNATHERLAFSMLQIFHTVLRVEDLGNAESNEKLRRDFGWNNFNPLGTRKTFNGVVGKRSLTFSAAEKVRLRELNSHDIALYKSVPALIP